MVRQRRWWLATDEPCAKTDKQLRLTNLLQRLVMFAPQFFVISNSYKRAQVILCITDIHHQSINRSINPSINNHSITIKLFKGGISMSVQGPLKEARWRNKTNFCWPAFKGPICGLPKRVWDFRKMSVCRSVCLSYADILSKCIIKLFFTGGYTDSSFFKCQTLWQYSNGDPITGASNAGVWKNRDFWPISRFISETTEDKDTVTMDC